MNKMKLNVEEPCHEKWNGMTPTEKGRFCKACAKEVVDFSVMPDSAIFEYFSNRQPGSVCGRFMNDQLNRDVLKERKRLPWVPFMAKIILPALLFSNKGKTQGAPLMIMSDTTQAETLKKGRVFMGNVMQQPIVMRLFNGVVRDENGQPIAGAHIINRYDLSVLVADEQGCFSMAVPKKSTEVSLDVEAVGYEKFSTVIKMTKRKWKNKVTIVLTDTYRLTTMGIVMMDHDKKVAVKEPKGVTAADFRFFPNPAASRQKMWLMTDSLEKGNYTLQVLNVAGAVIHQHTLSFDGKTKMVEWTVPEIAAGNYMLVIANASGRRRSGQLLVQ